MGDKIKTHVIIVSNAFPLTHSKNGSPTGFVHKIKSGDKIHTIRLNYKYWKDKINEVSEGKAILSVRTWEGAPYRSKQIEVARFTKEDGVGIQELSDISTYIELFGTRDSSFSIINNNSIGKHTGLLDRVNNNYVRTFLDGIPRLAKNDGLSEEDFREWFKTPLKESAAIIHFTNFRY